MQRKAFGMKLVSIILAAALLASCKANVTQPAATNETVTIIEEGGNVNITTPVISTATASYDDEDMYTDWTEEKYQLIELNDTSIEFTGTGAIVKDNLITIALPGLYVISGKLNDGQIVVDLETKGTVRLVLNGMNIHSSESAPIHVKKANKVILTLQDGTENFVSDRNDVYTKSTDDEPNAAIFSKEDLTLNGTGTLTVQANYNNGIMSKDDLIITGGNIFIKAVDDGLVGRDLVAVKEGTLSIEAAGDGIKSTNDSDASKGSIALKGGVMNIKAGDKGIKSVSNLMITGGQYTIASGE